MARTLTELQIFARSEWQMSLGERAALEGLLSQARPGISIEVGTAEGGSLDRIATHSSEVHAIDLTDDLLVECPSNATFHKGDSKHVLPRLLAGFAAADRNVDFALIDGDHSSEGVAADLSALLKSPAVDHTLILLHDSFNPDVRYGIESVGLGDHPKVAGYDLDFVSGRLGKLGAFENQFLGGFALVIVGDHPEAAERGQGIDLGFWSLRPSPVLFHDAHETARRAARLIEGPAVPIDSPQAPRLPLEREHIAREQLQRELESVRSSWSWRITAPLRALNARVRSLGGEHERSTARADPIEPPRVRRAGRGLTSSSPHESIRWRGWARLRSIPRRLAARGDRLVFPQGGSPTEHWQRLVLNHAVAERLASLAPSRCSAAEISGDTHADKGWKEYTSLNYPEFDLCAPVQEPRKFDVVICEQVLEHVVDPCAAAAGLRELCAVGGHVIVSTPFLVKVHEVPLFLMQDYWRFTPRGLTTLLQRAGLSVEAVGAWGNRQCVVGNLNRWSAYRPWHSMRNEPDFPLQVWAFARNGVDLGGSS